MAILKQVAALPVRRRGKNDWEVLLVTSRDTGRWVPPKGWPSKRLTDAGAAAREAREEAGVVGKISKSPIGSYRYFKRELNVARLVDVSVYLLMVQKRKKDWPEKEQRLRQWFPVEIAARRVKEPRLRSLIASLGKPRPAAASAPRSERAVAGR